MDRVMAELMGRSDGLCQGLGGSMHLVDRRARADGGHRRRRRQPAAWPPATRWRPGCAASDQVTVVFFGDGAVQAGHFNETVNLAALWELPLIFVCENNGFAEFTPRSAHTKVASVCDVVAPYDFERQTVDGADVPALWTAFGALRRDSARAGRGPVAAGVHHPPPARPLRGRRSRPTATRSPTPSGPRLDPIARLQASWRRATAGSTSDGAQALERRGARRGRARRSSSRRASPPLTPELAARAGLRRA